MGIPSVPLPAAAAIFRPGYQYYKAGVSAPVLVAANAVQPSLFDAAPDESGQRLMQVMDQINRRFGAGQIKYATVGLKQEWKSRVAYPSQRYTTCWDELPIVQA